MMNMYPLWSNTKTKIVLKEHVKNPTIIEFFLPNNLVSIVKHPTIYEKNSGVIDNAIFPNAEDYYAKLLKFSSCNYVSSDSICTKA